jgi:hypothetical protein
MGLVGSAKNGRLRCGRVLRPRMMYIMRLYTSRTSIEDLVFGSQVRMLVGERSLKLQGEYAVLAATLVQ